jgi:hypothetical protein
MKPGELFPQDVIEDLLVELDFPTTFAREIAEQIIRRLRDAGFAIVDAE